MSLDSIIGKRPLMETDRGDCSYLYSMSLLPFACGYILFEANNKGNYGANLTFSLSSVSRQNGSSIFKE